MMSSNRTQKESAPESHLFEEKAEASSKWIKIGALTCSLAVAVVLLVGYRHLRARQLESVRTAQQTEQAAKIVAPPEAQILEDEARLKGSQALVTGTIRNISNQRLEALSLEMELKRRANPQTTERRKINVEPADLAPGEEGRYTLTLLSTEWSGARVLNLNSDVRSEAIAFKTAVGTRRQPERLTQGSPKLVPAPPRPRPKGEEFINTPDNPTRIP